MRWRWDQGRLEYFRFENLKKAALVLQSLEGVYVSSREDLLRVPLTEGVELPFLPTHYKVWRNYGRVFRCAMLATEVGGRLVVTDLCRKLANQKIELSSDEYLNFVFSRFALPFPAFEDFDSTVKPVYPFAAIIKFAITHRESGVSLRDVFSMIIGNDCSGLEPLSHYAKLLPTDRKPIGDEERQVREMLAFMGQASYLKWFDRKLFIDSLDYDAILAAILPTVRVKRHSNADDEFFACTNLGTDTAVARFDVKLRDRPELDFAVREGGKVFHSHGRLERSPLVRRRFFIEHPNLVCDACAVDVKHRYPWTENILELHHILPLSATININGTTTTLDDMVALCPSCHKSIHLFYKIKLAEWDIPDFGSKKMAKDVYNLAKQEIIL